MMQASSLGASPERLADATSLTEHTSPPAQKDTTTAFQRAEAGDVKGTDDHAIAYGSSKSSKDIFE